MENYQVIERLGAGGQGTVFKATKLSNNTLVAIKKVKCETLQDLNQALKEAHAAASLKHPNIISCSEFFIDRALEKSIVKIHKDQKDVPDTNTLPQNENWSLCLVTSFCSLGTLKQHVERFKSAKKFFPEFLILQWTRQLLNALVYMHSSKFIHRDLKLENIFLHDDEHDFFSQQQQQQQQQQQSSSHDQSRRHSLYSSSIIQIGDLGLAKFLDKSFANSVVGTSAIIAPELRCEEPIYNEKIDIWGLGCMLCELCTLRRVDFAFHVAMMQNVAEETLFKPIKERYSEHLYEMVKQCLQLNPEMRPSALVLQQEFEKRFNNSNGSNNEVEEDGNNNSSAARNSLLYIEEQVKQQQVINNNDNNNNSTRVSKLMERLPRDILEYIFSFLQLNDLGYATRVCNSWRDVIEQNKYIWKDLYVHLFGNKQHGSNSSGTIWNKELESKLLSEFGILKRAVVHKSEVEKNWINSNSLMSNNNNSISSNSNSINNNNNTKRYNYKSFTVSNETLYGIALTKYSHLVSHHVQKLNSKKKSAIKSSNVCSNSYESIVFLGDANGSVHAHLISGLGEAPAASSLCPLKSVELFSLPNIHRSTVWALDYCAEKDPSILISGGFDGNVHLINTFTGEVSAKIQAHTFEIWDLCIMDNSSFITGSQDKNMKLFNTSTQQVIQTFDHAFFGSVYAVACDMEGMYKDCVAAGGLEGTCKLFDLKSGNCIFMDQYKTPSGNSVYEIQWLGNELIVGRGKGDITVYDIRKLCSSNEPIAVHLISAQTPDPAPTLPQFNADPFPPENKKLYSIDLKKNGSIRGMYCDGYKIVTGSSTSTVTVSSLYNGSVLASYDDVKNDTSAPEHKTNCTMNIDVCDNVLVTANNNGMLGVFDFSHVPSVYTGKCNYNSLMNFDKNANVADQKKCSIQ